MTEKQFQNLLAAEAVVHCEGGIWFKTNEGRFQCVSDGTLAELKASDIVRKICSKDKIIEMIDRVGFITVIQAPNEKVRKEFYQQAMDKYDELEWIRVIKTAYLHGQDQRLQPYEEAYAKQAANYFHGEAAYLLNLPFSSIEAYIGEKVTSDDW